MTRKPMNYYLRWRILSRDEFTCQYCGQYAPNVKLEVDHIIPVEDGGTDDPDNLATACYACNRGKCGFREQLRQMNRTPTTPTLYETNEKEQLIRPRQDEVYLIISQTTNGLTTSEIADKCNISPENARCVVHKLKTKGWIYKDDLSWFALIKENIVA